MTLLCEQIAVEPDTIERAQRAASAVDCKDMLFSLSVFQEPQTSPSLHRLLLEASSFMLTINSDFKFTDMLRAIAQRVPSVFLSIGVAEVSIDVATTFAQLLHRAAEAIDTTVTENSHIPGNIGLVTVDGITLRALDDALLRIIPRIYRKVPETPEQADINTTAQLSQAKTPTRPRLETQTQGTTLFDTREAAPQGTTLVDTRAAEDDSTGRSTTGPDTSPRSPPRSIFETHMTVTIPGGNSSPAWNGQTDNQQNLLFNLRTQTTAALQAAQLGSSFTGSQSTGSAGSQPTGSQSTSRTHPYKKSMKLSKDKADFGEPLEVIVAQSMISDPIIIACNDPKEVEKIANDKAEATSIYNAKNYIQCTGHAFEWKDCNCDFPHCPGCKRMIPLRAYKPEHRRALRLYVACVFRKDPEQMERWGDKNFYKLPLDCDFLESTKEHSVFYEASDWVKQRLKEIGINNQARLRFLRLEWVQTIIMHVLMARTWAKHKQQLAEIEAENRAANAEAMMDEMTRRGIDISATQRALSSGVLPSGGFGQGLFQESSSRST